MYTPKQLRLLPSAALVAMSTACVSTNAALLNPTVKYQKICPDAVVLFTSAARVPGDYYEVALLHSKGESSWTDEKQMMGSQRRKAAELGANGIILGDIREPNAGTKILGSLLGTGAERKGSAVAIYIPSDSGRVDRACGIAKNPAPVERAPEIPQSRPPAVSATKSPAPVRQVPASKTGVAEGRPASEPVAESEPLVHRAGETDPDPVLGYSAEPPTEPILPNDSATRSLLPVGTHWIAIISQKKYYPGTCAAALKLPEADRLYYETETAPQKAGFKRSEEC